MSTTFLPRRLSPEAAISKAWMRDWQEPRPIISTWNPARRPAKKLAGWVEISVVRSSLEPKISRVSPWAADCSSRYRPVIFSVWFTFPTLSRQEGIVPVMAAPTPRKARETARSIAMAGSRTFPALLIPASPE